jgi:hypothetical protein
MHLQVLDNFKSIFMKDAQLFLESEIVDNLLKIESIENLPNVMLYGSDEMVLECCLSILLNNISRSTTPPQKKAPDNTHQFPHYWHMHYLIVDMSDLLYQQKVNLITLLGKLSSHDSINPVTKRHIVVLKNFDKVSFSMMHRFKHVTESSGIFFVLIGKNISCVDKSIVSRCFSLRCVVNVQDNYDRVLKNLKIELTPDMIELYLKKSRGNITKFLLLLENKKHNFVFEDFLRSKLENMLSASSNRELLLCLSDTVSKIEVSGVRPESVCQHLVYICSSRFPTKNMCDIIGLLSECQRKFILSNKHSFLYEEMFIKLIFQVR